MIHSEPTGSSYSSYIFPLLNIHLITLGKQIKDKLLKRQIPPFKPGCPVKIEQEEESGQSTINYDLKCQNIAAPFNKLTSEVNKSLLPGDRHGVICVHKRPQMAADKLDSLHDRAGCNSDLCLTSKQKWQWKFNYWARHCYEVGEAVTVWGDNSIRCRTSSCAIKTVYWKNLTRVSQDYVSLSWHEDKSGKK